MIPLRTRRERTDSQVMMNCNATSKAIAAKPSASDTSLLIKILDKVEPKATVTTRSQEFIFDRVRLPLMRSNNTVPA